MTYRPVRPTPEFFADLDAKLVASGAIELLRLRLQLTWPDISDSNGG